MLTVVMPFYKKLKEFLFAFDLFHYHGFNDWEDLELIISIDDPYESEELISYLKQKTLLETPRFSIKVFRNEQKHFWRCPSKAINVGIRHARHQKIMVFSPESIPVGDSLPCLFQNCDEDHFSIGIIKCIPSDKIDPHDLRLSFLKHSSLTLPYGSICFTKTQADKVGGYDESFLEWGGDDDDFRARLQKAGYKLMPTLAKWIHLDFENRTLNQTIRSSHLSKKIQSIAQKKSYVANKNHYGFDFNSLVFCYRNHEPISH